MIVGVVGKKRAGKDTIASYLKERHNFHQTSFAKALKEICAEVFDLTQAQLEGELKEVPDTRFPEHWSPRHILQKTGTEAGRLNDFSWSQHYAFRLKGAFKRRNLKPNPTLWIDIVLDEIMHYENSVISDVRFINEASALRSLGAQLLKVVRSDLSKDTHVSESEVDKILVDSTIINNSSIQALHVDIEKSLFAPQVKDTPYPLGTRLTAED